ncbi:MAG TPA: HYR domain-containing protein, partial [Streptosporangiaceae bacterium]
TILALIVVRVAAQSPDKPGEFDPAVLQFGEQQVSTTSSAHGLTVRNKGTSQLRVTAIRVEGHDRGDFRVTANGCGAPVGPGRSCSVGVSFRPTALGGRTANLVLRLSGATTLPQVPLSGTGVRGSSRAPVLNVRDLVVEATSKDGAIVRYFVTAVDDVDGDVPVDCRPTSGSVFFLGTTHVNCTASDRSGNSTSGGFTVTVRDSSPPVVTVPGDATAEAVGPDGAIVEFAQPTASDRVDGPVAARCKPLSGGRFSLGTTEVSCSAVDGHGNTGTASFAVIVRDTTPPTIGEHEDLIVEAPSSEATGVTVTFDPPSARDTVDMEVTVSCSPASGSFLTLGLHTVSCIAIDDSGNRSGPSQFTVDVASGVE